MVYISIVIVHVIIFVSFNISFLVLNTSKKLFQKLSNNNKIILLLFCLMLNVLCVLLSSLSLLSVISHKSIIPSPLLLVSGRATWGFYYSCSIFLLIVIVIILADSIVLTQVLNCFGHCFGLCPFSGYIWGRYTCFVYYVVWLVSLSHKLQWFVDHFPFFYLFPFPIFGFCFQSWKIHF